MEQRWMSILLPLLILYNSKTYFFFYSTVYYWFWKKISHNRSPISTKFLGWFLVSWCIGCSFPSNVLVCSIIILAVCLSWPAPEWSTLHDILSSKTVAGWLHLDFHDHCSSVAKIRRSERSYVQLQVRYTAFLRELTTIWSFIQTGAIKNVIPVCFFNNRVLRYSSSSHRPFTWLTFQY